MADKFVSRGVATLHASITAMPAGNVVVAAPGANLSLVIDSVCYVASTATANQEVAVGPTTTTLAFRRVAANKGDSLYHTLGQGWMLDTNTSFGVWLATTGAVHISVEYRVMDRSV